jgi:hypothetical protein
LCRILAIRQGKASNVDFISLLCKQEIVELDKETTRQMNDATGTTVAPLG